MKGNLMQLSSNFYLNEFIKSDYAKRHNIDNLPSEEVISNLKYLCVNILQPLREQVGAIRILSGYRSPTLNRLIGGSKTSKHIEGRAADIECTTLSNYNLACFIRDNIPEFGQVILEFYTPGDPYSGWVHVSSGTGKQCLTAYKENGKTLYKVGLHA